MLRLFQATPKLKITTAGGRIHVQNSSKPVVTTSMPVATAPAVGLAPASSLPAGRPGAAPPLKLAKGHNDRTPPGSHKGAPRSNCRSRSDAVGGGGGGSKVDTKLSKTPTIKLKPISVPSGAGGGAGVGAGGGAGGAVPGGVAPAAAKGPRAPVRKNSLSAVIDKLTKQQTTVPGVAAPGGAAAAAPPDKGSTTKERADAIRLRILSEGSKPSTPPKDAGGGAKSLAASGTSAAGCKLAFESKLVKGAKAGGAAGGGGGRGKPGSGRGGRGHADGFDGRDGKGGGNGGRERHAKARPPEESADAQQARHFLDIVSSRFGSPARDGATAGAEGADRKAGRTAGGARPDAVGERLAGGAKAADAKTREVSAASRSVVASADVVVKTVDAVRTPRPPPKPDADATKAEDLSMKTMSSSTAVISSSSSSSENKENSAHDRKDDGGVFKAPTPKPSSAVAPPPAAVGGGGRAKPPHSPHSDLASSPEDSLVIDCPPTPGHTHSPRPQQQRLSPAPLNSPSAAAAPPARKAAKLAVSPASPMVKSPMSQRNVGSPASRSSPCEIDDELMDAALGLC